MSAKTPLLAAALVFGAGLVRAEDRAFEWRQLPNRAFRVGETIKYSLKYGVVLAGRASLEVKEIETLDGRRAYHIVSHARTNKTLDQAFMVRDSNDSWMDVESLCSLQFMQNIREGGYKKWTLTRVNQPRGTFTYHGKGKTRDDVKEGEAPPFVQDVLSSLYYVRSLDLKTGEEHRMDAASGGAVWPLKVTVKGVERVEVPAGSFECFRVEPVLAGEGLFQNKGKLEVWLTKDKRKIPVLLRSEVAVGAFEAQMREYSVFGKNLSALEDDE